MSISIITKSGVVLFTAVLFAALPIGLTLPVQAADLLVERTMGFAPMVRAGCHGIRCCGGYIQSLCGQNSCVRHCRATHVG